MLPLSGLSSLTGLRIIDETRDQQISQLRAAPINQRAVESFVAGIGSITSAKDLTANFEVYSFVMRAFDLEDQIFGRGLMRRLLESDPEDPSSLVNRLTDKRFRVIHDALGFARSPEKKPDFSSPAWQANIIDRYFSQTFENNAGDQNPTIGTVLKFRREAPSLTNWFQVLRDKELSDFFRTSLGLPKEMSNVDIDKQKSIFESRFDLRSLSDPGTQEDLITRYTAISDVQSPPKSISSTAISLLRGGAELGVIVSLDISQVSYSPSALLR